MHRKKIFILFFCLILLIGISFPLATTNASGQTVKIATDVLNIRGGPGLSYPVVAKAEKGQNYPFLSESKDWIEIQLDNGKKGWVANWLVTKETSENSQTTINKEANDHATVTANGLRVRKGPGTNHQVIGTINKGEKFPVTSTDGDWVQLNTTYGLGWVAKNYIQFNKKTTTNNNKTASSNGKITASSLNVRSTPSLEGSVIGKLAAGEMVEILSQKNGWTEISYSGKSAWISSQYVEVTGSTPSTNVQQPNDTSKSSNRGTVTATSLKVRSEGSLNGKAIGSVSKGQTFNILQEANNWAKIEYKKGAYGWVASWYLDKAVIHSPESSKQPVKDLSISIIHNGSNIRKEANTSSAVVKRVNKGDTFQVISVKNDWYEVDLSNGSSGFIAGWIVSVNGSAPSINKPGSKTGLKDKTIIIDPGHGGRDGGTTGASGTQEKTITLKTAQLLYNKLNAAGANVILTRNSDTYLPLVSRVQASHYHNADAFISIHYDSITDRSVKGMTTYYYHSYQKKLANSVHSSIASSSSLKDRGYRFGDYYVLRENKRNAILLELGYLSNPTEEILVKSGQYQDSVTNGIYQGLVKYFQ